jgi:hypothetical protein
MTESSFSFFHFTAKSCERCCIAFDTPTMTNQSDATSNRLCCEQCEFWCWPFCITFDIISCPIRLSHHTCHNVSCKKKQPVNTPNVVKSQPTKS